MPEPTEAELEAYEIWKGKHPDGNMLLAKRRDLREFKEKFGADTSSNLHCPWCFTGRLYRMDDLTVSDLYVCRGCELKFSITCYSQDALNKMIAEKKEERQNRREENRKGNKEAQLAATQEVEAFHASHRIHQDSDSSEQEDITEEEIEQAALEAQTVLTLEEITAETRAQKGD